MDMHEQVCFTLPFCLPILQSLEGLKAGGSMVCDDEGVVISILSAAAFLVSNDLKREVSAGLSYSFDLILLKRL